VGKGWNSCASVLVSFVKEMQTVDREVGEHGSHILVHLASQEDVYDVWLLRYMEGLLFNVCSSFNDCLHVLVRVMGKYFFETQRKHTIIHRVLIHLRSKIQQTQWTLKEIA
jgi:hypothetical protein